MNDLPGDFAPDLLSERWEQIEDDTGRARFEDELRREVQPGHRLWQTEVIVVAARLLYKEVIYWLPAQGAWAWVHLTWTTETNPSFPRAVVVASWVELIDELANAGRS